ncbi:hypothetical protein [Lacrimispora brassicae]
MKGEEVPSIHPNGNSKLPMEDTCYSKLRKNNGYSQIGCFPPIHGDVENLILTFISFSGIMIQISGRNWKERANYDTPWNGISGNATAGIEEIYLRGCGSNV